MNPEIERQIISIVIKRLFGDEDFDKTDRPRPHFSAEELHKL
jgi:hypothetical protein